MGCCGAGICCGVGSFACGVGNGAGATGRGARGVWTAIGGGVALGDGSAGLTAAVGAGTDGVGDGAFCTTPLGESAVPGRYSHASVPPRIAIGMPINKAMKGTTRRFLSSSVGPPTSGAGPSYGGYES